MCGLFQKKCNFNLSISPGAPGSLTLTYGIDSMVGQPVFVSFPQVSIGGRNFKKVAFLFGKECTTRSIHEEWDYFGLIELKNVVQV